MPAPDLNALDDDAFRAEDEREMQPGIFGDEPKRDQHQTLREVGVFRERFGGQNFMCESGQRDHGLTTHVQRLLAPGQCVERVAARLAAKQDQAFQGRLTDGITCVGRAGDFVDLPAQSFQLP